MTAADVITPVILSGGAGTRLWPLSRPRSPKQLHRLAGAQTMLQATAARVADRTLFAAPLVVAGADHEEAVAAQLEAIGAAPARLIVEPEGRNTAAAIALAALAGPADTRLLVMPSDHVIADPGAFLAAVRTAAPAAQDGWLVTFGIRPTAPETGYGYIRRGEALAPGLFRASAFVEKPSRDRAEAYLADGGYDWNGGIFLFRADALLAALVAHAPDILEGVRASLAEPQDDGCRLRPEPGAFSRVRAQSIDHAVMEQAERIAVVPVDMGWSDLGSWDALYEAGAADAAGNGAAGDVLALDARDCLLRSEGPTLVAVGVEDLVVVATPDAVLVTRRGDAQRVREAVDILNARSSGPRS